MCCVHYTSKSRYYEFISSIMSNILMRKNDFLTFSSVKGEYLNINAVKSDMLSNVLPQIAIKKTKDGKIVDGLQIGLFNGSWDYSGEIPSIVADMHEAQYSYLNSEAKSGKYNNDNDHIDKNLAWLLNYKFIDLIPVSGIREPITKKPVKVGENC